MTSVSQKIAPISNSSANTDCSIGSDLLSLYETSFSYLGDDFESLFPQGTLSQVWDIFGC